MGENAETLFKKLLVKLGDVDEARIDGQLTHIDFILKRNDKPALKYEVKSRKKVRRSEVGYMGMLITWHLKESWTS
jgi:metal-sulfur cluster biosynthetic enzyme